MNSVFDLMKEYEERGDFAHSLVNENMIKEAEKKLKVRLPETYKRFLIEFGFGGLDGIEILGVAKNGRVVFVDTTLKLRELGMPQNLIVIEMNLRV